MHIGALNPSQKQKTLISITNKRLFLDLRFMLNANLDLYLNVD